ncbi:MAG TPA: hypothetical protein VFE48_01460 [Methylomirabilota bacterium]|nr:hypothetical protein [Methylomirabilota bacterium]
MGIPIESSPPPGWEREGIDGLLGLFPPGRLSEVVGSRSSGASSLLLALIARITTAGGQVAFVDATDSLDPDSAAAAGADLSALLWVRCGGRLRVALGAADLLARCPGFALVVLDLDDLGPVPASTCIRLQRAVEDTDTILILRVARHREGSPASLVLTTRRLGPQWMGLRPLTRLAGLRSEIAITRVRISTLSSPGRGQGEGHWAVEWSLQDVPSGAGCAGDRRGA